jgi:phosphoglycolate phosphatase-like HAD superfamily hydrolase
VRGAEADVSTKRLLLFDIDGTLVTCRGHGLRAMGVAMQQHFGLAPVEAAVQAQGKTDPMLFEEMAAAYGVSLQQLEASHPHLQEAYVAALEAALRVPGSCQSKPGVLALLAQLASHPGVVLGLVSGNLERTAWLKLEAAGLHRYFAGGAFGSDGRRRADLVALAVSRFAAREGMPFHPERIWVIGDTPDDIAGGRAHGVRTLAVATGGYSRAQLEPHAPDSLLDDFTATARVLDIFCRDG